MNQNDNDVDSAKDARLKTHFREFGSRLPSNFAWLVIQKIARERIIRAQSIASLQAVAIGVAAIFGLLPLLMGVGAYLDATTTISFDRFSLAGVVFVGISLIMAIDRVISLRRL